MTNTVEKKKLQMTLKRSAVERQNGQTNFFIVQQTVRSDYEYITILITNSQLLPALSANTRACLLRYFVPMKQNSRIRRFHKLTIRLRLRLFAIQSSRFIELALSRNFAHSNVYGSAILLKTHSPEVISGASGFL
ncbi:hypothetical protein NPIL_172521 [Nephila pilipes]|uniref:Uncharacterized protein n=1 Tax=Nephila pilipes TaxID=299642 RepID=A0A8X6T7E8_NEPPI|nr:hypothetical protein NPIL_172521 [Nephila pilipes]